MQTLAVIIVFAILGGASLEGGGGFLVGGFIGYLFMRLLKAEKKIAALSTASIPSSSVTPEEKVVPQTVPQPIVSQPIEATPVVEKPAEVVLPVHAAEPRPKPVVAPVPPSGPSIIESWMAFAGRTLGTKNPIVVFGTIILLFGMAFLLTFAVQEGYLTVSTEAKLFLAAIAGLLLVGAGLKTRSARPDFGTALIGGGAGVLYLTTHFAYRITFVIGATEAVIFFSLIALGSGYFAEKFNSLPLALIGVLGGFLAPILSSSGSGNHVALFSFMLVLNLLVLRLSAVRNWPILSLVGFLFTFGISLAWGMKYYVPEHRSSVEPFLIAHFLLFNLAIYFSASRRRVNNPSSIESLVAVGTGVIGMGLQAALFPPESKWVGGALLIAAAFYLAAAYGLRNHEAVAVQVLRKIYTALGAVFSLLAVPVFFDPVWTCGAWAIIGAALCWSAHLRVRLGERILGTVALLASGFALIGDLGIRVPAEILAFDRYVTGGLTIAIASLFAGSLGPNKSGGRPFLMRVAAVWGIGWWFGCMRDLIDRLTHAGALLYPQVAFSEVASLMALHRFETLCLLVLSISSTAFLIIGWRRSATELFFVGRYWFLLVPIFLLFAFEKGNVALTLQQLGLTGDNVGTPIQFVSYNWLAGGGIFVWPASMVLAIYGFVTVERIKSEVPQILHLIFSVVVAYLGTALFARVFPLTLRPYDVSSSSGASFLFDSAILGFSVSIVTMLMAVLLPRLSFLSMDTKEYYKSTIVKFFGVICILLFLSSLQLAGTEWGQPYRPIVDLVDILEIVLLISVLVSNLSRRAIGILSFLFINAVAARAVHWWLKVPYNLWELLHSPAFAATTSLLWGGLAVGLILYATKSRDRRPWILGASLLGAVGVKLFIIDLANSGSLSRVISFLGVGLLMIVIGYLSPIPPIKSGKE